MAAAATSFASVVSSPFSSLPLRHLFQSSQSLGPLLLFAGHRATCDGGGGIRAAGPPRLQGLLAAPIPPRWPPPLTGRLLLRGPRAGALPQPRALRHIRQRWTQGAIFTAADFLLFFLKKIEKKTIPGVATGPAVEFASLKWCPNCTREIIV